MMLAGKGLAAIAAKIPHMDLPCLKRAQPLRGGARWSAVGRAVVAVDFGEQGVDAAVPGMRRCDRRLRLCCREIGELAQIQVEQLRGRRCGFPSDCQRWLTSATCSRSPAG